jgi:superfamily I DNA/RNA helicase
LGGDAVLTELPLEGAALDAALAHPLDGPLLILEGPAGTGKTTALLRRALFAAGSPERRVLLATPSVAGTERLRARIPASRTNVACASLGSIAFDVLREARRFEGKPDDLTEIDEARAAIVFEGVGAELFSLEWSEFALAEIDPEITGLRAPERFADAAFRLIRKLRASLLSPEDFKNAGLRGAAKFYGHPPNFADPGLLLETSKKYRDSLRASKQELERQHEREIDLVKVLARLYSAYADVITANGCLTAVDAVYEATLLLRRRPELRARARERFSYAAIDDAQDLTGADLGLLAMIFDDDLARITFAGDKEQATRGFAAGARGWDGVEGAVTIPCTTRYRETPVTSLYRATDARDEARAIAGDVRSSIASGTAPGAIAIVTRNLGCAHAYIDALLAYDIPVDVAGAMSLYDFPVLRDALAALWSVVDPFRHDYLLRNLEAPWLRLSDASIAALCGDPADPQPLLFEIPGEDPDEARAGRWDRKRDLRLARNVTRGDCDAELPGDARARLIAFREARSRWERAERTLGPGDLARTIFAESVLATLPASARGRFDAHLVGRLSAAIDAFEARDPLATLADFLEYAERVATAESDLLSLELRDRDAVRVLDVEAAKGEEFDVVFVPDLRAGAWPRYYVPDAFLFLPSAGMVPKDNVGDAGAARTAKFTYTLYRYKLREKYVAEERRAFSCASSRARRRLFLSASGSPTRGVAAPEILAELEKGRAKLIQS